MCRKGLAWIMAAFILACVAIVGCASRQDPDSSSEDSLFSELLDVPENDVTSDETGVTGADVISDLSEASGDLEITEPDVCVPDCKEKFCGDDGCLDTCGICGPSFQCVDFMCLA